MSVSVPVPPEFSKILNDFIKDLYTTFPEYIPFIEKWRKPPSSFLYIQDLQERNIAMEQSNKKSDEYIFQFCSKKYPPRFFDFLYKNEDLFKEDSEIDTEFLPHIYFKSLWKFNIDINIGSVQFFTQDLSDVHPKLIAKLSCKRSLPENT